MIVLDNLLTKMSAECLFDNPYNTQKTMIVHRWRIVLWMPTFPSYTVANCTSRIKTNDYESVAIFFLDLTFKEPLGLF